MRHSFKKYSLNWGIKAFDWECNGRMPKKKKGIFQKEQMIPLKTYIEIIKLLTPLHIHICTNA